jgi:hypothetical protein
MTATGDITTTPAITFEAALTVTSPQTATGMISSLKVETATVPGHSMIVVYTLVGGAPRQPHAGVSCIEPGVHSVVTINFGAVANYAYTTTDYLVTLVPENVVDDGCVYENQEQYPFTDEYTEQIVHVVLLDAEPPPTPTVTPEETPQPEVVPTPLPPVRLDEETIGDVVDAVLDALPTPVTPDVTPETPPATPPTPIETPDPDLFADAIVAAVLERLPAPERIPTPGDTPTPVVDRIRASSQESDGRSAIIDELVTTQDRWLVIYHLRPEGGAQIVGRAYIPIGEYEQIRVLFQRSAPRGAVLNATLHQDGGQRGVFDYPGADPPVTVGGAVVEAEFVLALPFLSVADQRGPAVVVNSAILTEHGWVVLYDPTDQAIIGHEAAPPGLTTGLIAPVVGLNSGAARDAVAMLHIDQGLPGVFEFPGPDIPVQNAAGAAVQSTFNFTYEPVSATPAAAPVAARATPIPSPTSVASPTPIATPALFSPPNQYAPPNLAPYNHDRITFQWRWAGELEENWGFEVRGWLPEDPHNGIHDARITAGMKPDEFGVYSLNLRIPDKFKGRIWYWTVAVVQLDPYKRIGPEAPPSIIVVPPGASRGIDGAPAPTPVATPVAQSAGEG